MIAAAALALLAGWAPEVLIGPEAARAVTCVVPEGPIRARAVLPDGRRALARPGAVEIDGRRWTGCDGLPGSDPTALAVFEGRLVVGFGHGGLAALRGGRFDRLQETGDLPPSPVRALAAAEGALFVGTADQGLWRLAAGRATRLAHPVLGRGEIAALAVAADGGLEVAAGGRGWWHLARPGAARAALGARRVGPGGLGTCFRESGRGMRLLGPGSGCDLGPAPPASGLPSGHVTALAEHGGRLYVGTFDRGLARLGDDGRFEAAFGRAPTFVNALLSAPGTLWIGTAQGLFRLDDGDEAPHRVLLGLGRAAEHVVDLCRGRTGTLFLATGAGLVALGPGGARLLSESAGLPSHLVYAVAEAADGAIFVGTAAGAVRLDSDGSLRRFTQAGGQLPHDWVTALLPDGAGMLAGTYDAGVARLDAAGGGAPERDLGRLWVNPHGLALLGGDALALATLGDGLVVRAAGRIVRVAGLPSDDVTALAVHRGALFVGTRGGLVRIAPLR